MSLVQLDAVAVVTEHPEGACDFVGFTDDSEIPLKYLLLQRDLEGVLGLPNDLDLVHLEWCDQLTSGYGLIECASLSTDSLDLFLSAKGQDVLGGITQLTITFDLPIAVRDQLHQSLAHIFRSTNRLQIAAA